MKKTLLAVLGLTVFAAACADGPMAPEMADVPLMAAFGGGNGGSNNDGGSNEPLRLEWKSTLTNDITVSEACSPDADCELRIPNLGFTMTIPRNALSEPTTILVTALAGDYVNFSFGPHGTQFLRDISVGVDVRNTKGAIKNNTRFKALYWVDGLENVQEEIPATFKNDIVTFQTDHFSGYAIAM